MNNELSNPKNLLRSSAKLFANFEYHAELYGKFKTMLIEEFGKALNIAIKYIKN